MGCVTHALTHSLTHALTHPSPDCSLCFLVTPESAEVFCDPLFVGDLLLLWDDFFVDIVGLVVAFGVLGLVVVDDFGLVSPLHSTVLVHWKVDLNEYVCM